MQGRTPAHCGAAKGQLETLKLLARYGAALWQQTLQGDLPLHCAVQSGRKAAQTQNRILGMKTKIYV